MSTRILVVEDQADNRRILRDLLNSVGYEILELRAERRRRSGICGWLDAYVAKPFSTRALLAKVRAYLPLQPS